MRTRCLTATAAVGLLLSCPAVVMAQSATPNAAGSQYQQETTGTVQVAPVIPPTAPTPTMVVPAMAPSAVAPAVVFPPSSTATKPAKTVPIANPSAVAPAATQPIAVRPVATTTLPFTGSDARLVLLIGVGLLAGALVLRRLTRSS